ncbi:hypothetical protein K402DRAFT_392082 [Aulographum hederae CBS 113979]|uniref:Adhesin domain-containing protein n=1 Tax=Aulographum hederae CBS 113979 TaxID=1176131 RepID=A0A6G1H538_9PEZI|nr:hypothetical protein K402DRAFT_392082 [Aulographum hederae CBS 113979]
MKPEALVLALCALASAAPLSAVAAPIQKRGALDSDVPQGLDLISTNQVAKTAKEKRGVELIDVNTELDLLPGDWTVDVDLDVGLAKKKRGVTSIDLGNIGNVDLGEGGGEIHIGPVDFVIAKEKRESRKTETRGLADVEFGPIEAHVGQDGVEVETGPLDIALAKE